MSTTTMFEPFLIHALLAGLGISLMTGPLGCFIAWKKLAYFGDTVAHAALLGAALSLLLGAPLALGLLATALLLAFIVARLPESAIFSSDTILGICAHGALALALVLIALSPSMNFDVNGLLFGDILAVTQGELLQIYGAAFLVSCFVLVRWKAFMRCIIHADIAQVEGTNAKAARLQIMLLIALVVAVSIKLVGVLLITSLLIIPAAAARLLAKSPSQMAMMAVVISSISVVAGLQASLQFDIPTGPAIILSALSALLLLGIIRKFKNFT